MNKKDLVIVGTGGFAKEVLWLLEDINKTTCEWNILGFVDKPNPAADKNFCGYRILGDDQWLLRRTDPVYVVLGIGNSNLRRKLAEKYERNSNLCFPNIISKNALLSDRLSLGKGCIICAGAILTVDIRLGDFVNINLNCTVGHDALLDSFATLHPGVNISGNVHVGTGTEIGTGTSIIQGISVGDDAVIGAGTVVIRDIKGHCTAVGNPAKILHEGNTDQ